MPMTSTINDSNMQITFSGKFTFGDSPAYRKLLVQALEAKVKSIVCDLSGLTFMDSSGLGMLMVTLKECQQNNIALELRKPQADVKHLLEMTKAHERFRITG